MEPATMSSPSDTPSPDPTPSPTPRQDSPDPQPLGTCDVHDGDHHRQSGWPQSHNCINWTPTPDPTPDPTPSPCMAEPPPHMPFIHRDCESRIQSLTAQVEKLQRERDDWKHNAESQFAAIAEQVRMRDEALAELARLRPVVEAAKASYQEEGADYCWNNFPPPPDCECAGCRLHRAIDALEAQ